MTPNKNALCDSGKKNSLLYYCTTDYFILYYWFILQLNQNVNAKILKKHGFNLFTCLQILISLLKGHHQLISRPEYAQQVGTFTS